MSDTKRRVISMHGPDIEPEGVIWVATGGGKKSLCPARILGDRVKSYVDDLEEGETIELCFSRVDMTGAEIAAIPEV